MTSENPSHPSLLLGSLGYGVVSVGLYFALFVGLGQVLPESVFLNLPTMGFVLGVLAWWVFEGVLNARYWVISAWASFMSLLVAGVLIVFEAETAICLIIGFPLFLPGILVGVSLGRWWTRRNTRRRSSTFAVVLGLPFLAMGLDAAVAYPEAKFSVSTVIDISASPEVVWAQTLDIPEIQEDEQIWTLSHALLRAPQPISAKLDDNTRDLQWTKGVVFQELIDHRQTHHYLGWKFAFHAPETLAAFDAHISPDSRFLRLTRGEYRLEQTSTGTRLHLTTTYLLNTPYNSYLNLWGERFLQDFHSSVLAVIKTRAELEEAT